MSMANAIILRGARLVDPVTGLDACGDLAMADGMLVDPGSVAGAAVTDLEGLAREFGLSREEYEAIRDQDPRRLMDLGVHQYYVPQILRLFFGAALALLLCAALECYRRAYPEETAQALALQERLERSR